MTTALTPVNGLPGFVACRVHNLAGRTRDAWACPSCIERDGPAASKAGESPAGRRARLSPGRAAEDAMVLVMQDMGESVVDFGGWLEMVERDIYRGLWCREYPWGATLNPPRRFRSDFAMPSRRLLLEIEGQVHSIKGKRKGDVLRRQLAEGAGYRVLSVLPAQVKDGTALALVRAALNGGA